MSDQAKKTRTNVVLLAAEPQLFVRYHRIVYFASKLGFSIGFTYGEPPFYAQVARCGPHQFPMCR